MILLFLTQTKTDNKTNTNINIKDTGADKEFIEDNFIKMLKLMSYKLIDKEKFYGKQKSNSR